MRLFGSNTTLELGTSSLALGLRPRGYEPVTPVMIFSVTVLPLSCQTHHCAINTFFYVEISAIYWNLYEPSLIYSAFCFCFFYTAWRKFPNIKHSSTVCGTNVWMVRLLKQQKKGLRKATHGVGVLSNSRWIIRWDLCSFYWTLSTKERNNRRVKVKQFAHFDILTWLWSAYLNSYSVNMCTRKFVTSQVKF